MSDEYLARVISNIAAMSDALDENGLIANTREAVLNGIKTFHVTPDVKAKLYANFEMQFSIQVVTKLIDAVMQGGVIEQQIEVEKNKAELILKQIETEIENTIKVTKEHELLAENKLAVIAQTATEEKRRLDVMAGINIKNEQALSTRQSAKFEEARRHVLINSTLFNNQIQKSKEENATLNSLALDDGFTITEGHLTRVKAALDGITLTPISYAEELSAPVGVVDAGA